jgi:glycogen debranching enzyme
MPRLSGAGGGKGAPQAPSSPTLVLHAGYTVLCAALDGSIQDDPTGLYDYDTRILSRYRLTIDDRAPELVSSARPEADMLVARYRVPRPGGNASGPLLPEDTLDLELERRVGAGMLDDWTLHNRSAVPWQGRLRLEVDADFADIAEVGAERRQRGELTVRLGPRSLELRYDARSGRLRFTRAMRVRLLGSPPSEDSGTSYDADVSDSDIALRVHIAPQGELRLPFRVTSRVAGQWRSPDASAGEVDVHARARQRATWRVSRLRVEGAERLRVPAERAIEDLFALRNQDLESDLLSPPGAPRRQGWVLNAGVPTFTGFFGRDALTAGWQSALAGTAALRGALEVCASTQATEDDPWRDAEPGKMLHELRRGPLSTLGVWPRDAYYGSQTAPAFFVVALSELWHWTGDDRVLRRFRDPALRAIEWADGTTNAAGFVTYVRRSSAGLANQGWKDSNEAIRHADGRLAEAPMATVEEQAFHYLALQRLAEILVVLGDEGAADALLDRAAAFRSQFHEAFWMPREGFYAMAIDAEGDQVASIGSNPGHALASGIVPPEHARMVADRLMSPALFSGWGVRTLSAEHPSYNPLAYHLGAVWPVENATIALGLKRYGLDDHLDRLAEALLEGAAASPEGRLPEALTGHPRLPNVPPTPYPDACSPQAWSASAVVQTLQLMLGLYPFAPLRMLATIRPRLPMSVPEVTLRNVRVGGATADLRFTRNPDGSAKTKVIRQDGTLFVAPSGPPANATGTSRSWFEQLERAALRRAPGPLVRAARIAIGLEEQS